jgi:hypothetical protein
MWQKYEALEIHSFIQMDHSKKLEELAVEKELDLAVCAALQEKLEAQEFMMLPEARSSSGGSTVGEKRGEAGQG